MNFEETLRAELEAARAEKQTQEDRRERARLERIEKECDRMMELTRQGFGIPDAVPTTFWSRDSADKCVLLINNRWMVSVYANTANIMRLLHWDFNFTCSAGGCFTRRRLAAEGSPGYNVFDNTRIGHMPGREQFSQDMRAQLAAAIESSTWRCPEHSAGERQ